MSLNKFTDDNIKNYLSVGCDKIKCNSIDASNLKINGNPINITSDIIEWVPTYTISPAPHTLLLSNFIYYTVGKYLYIDYRLNLTINVPTQDIVLSIYLPTPYTALINSYHLGNSIGTIFGLSPFTLKNNRISATLNNVIQITLTNQSNITAFQNIDINGNIIIKTI